MKPSEKLVSFAVGLSYEDLPKNVLLQLKLSVLDTIGVGIFAATKPWSKILLGMIGRNEAKPESVVWGSTIITSFDNAALANGTFSHGFEFDEIHVASLLHPGSVVIPAALSMAERKSGVDGKSLLAAIAAGYECGIRIGLAMSRSFFNRGFHPQGVIGTMAATVAASKIMGADREVMTEALGIAASLASGLMGAQYGGYVKRLNSGNASRNAVIASFLASNGFTGVRDVLKLEFGGFCSSFGGQPGPLKVNRSLGKQFEILNVGPKIYPCVASCHTTIDIVKELMSRYASVRARNIRKVVVKASKPTKLHTGWKYEPYDIVAAQMNLSFAVAALLIDDELFVEQYTDEKISDPKIIALARRIEVQEDTEIEALGPNLRHAVKVEIHLKDGNILKGEAHHRKGSPQKPITSEDYLTKFRRLVNNLVGVRKSEEIIASVTDIEKCSDVKDFTKLLMLS